MTRRPQVGQNKVLLDFLIANSDERGHVRVGVPEIVQATHLTTTQVVARCWILEKMGLLTFREHHTQTGSELQNLQLRKHLLAKRTKSSVLFDMSFEVVQQSTEDVRQEKLRSAARLLEESGEIELALLTLDAMSGIRREYVIESLYFPGPGRIIRKMSRAEMERAFAESEDI